MSNNKKKYTSAALSEMAVQKIRELSIPSIEVLCRELRVSRNTFSKYGLDVKDLFAKAGFIKYPFKQGGMYAPAGAPDPLETRLKELILRLNRYITGREAADLLAVNASTFLYKGISVYKVNLELGFKPSGKGMKPYWTHGEKALYIGNLESKYKDLIIRFGRPVPVEEFAKYAGITFASIYRKLRNPKLIHQECGIDYLCLPSKQDAIRKCTEVILRLGRYVSSDQLVQETGISEFLLQKYLVSVLRFNESLGFKGSTSTFEDRVYELLSEVFGKHKIIRQKIFQDLRSDKNRPLPFDFYIESEGLLIEADGSQHWDKGSKFYKDRVVELDGVKESYCSEKGFTLLRIRYNQRLTKKHIHTLLSGIPLKHSIGQPAAKPKITSEGSETIRKE